MPELYTIGYEGVSQAALLQTLVFHDVQALLDIRERPQSRKPGLSKTALGAAAAGFGIQYAHLGALGTPREVRYRRKIDHDAEAFREGYLAHLATQDEAMAALVARAESERCCLLVLRGGLFGMPPAVRRRARRRFEQRPFGGGSSHGG